jgi:hypothetical protein
MSRYEFVIDPRNIRDGSCTSRMHSRYFFSNGNATARCKNHPMENKLIKIFEI